jgi:oligoendopeptidase F
MELQERKDLDPAYMWDLTPIYTDDAAWEKDLEKLAAEVPDMARFAGSLHTAQGIRSFFDAEVDLGTRLEKLYLYASLRNSEDATQEAAKSMDLRARSLVVTYQTVLSFAEPEILSQEEGTLRGFIDDPVLAPHKLTMQRLLDQKKHTLTSEEERIIASYGEVLSAPYTIYHDLDDADLRFHSVPDGQGVKTAVNNANFVLLQTSTDRTLRKNAFQSYYRTFKSHVNTIAATMAANVKYAEVTARLRHYDRARAMKAEQERVPTAVYDNLIEAVRRHLPDMYRYVRLRRRLLGVDQLHFYDIYAPLLQEEPKKYTYDQAKDLLFRAIRPLGPDYARIVKSGLEGGWVDVYPNKGKRGGAFSSGTYLTNPYLLMNFTGSLDSVSTLAHEMGHSVHTYLSNHNQPPQYADYTIFVAEVASTVNENLLIEALLEEEEDPTRRLALLNQYLENFKGTVYRQTMFAEFEKQVHEASAAGTALTPQFMCDIYRTLNQDYFGPDMVIDDEIAYEWARIPHFYTPFYVYKYATSYSAAVALSEGLRAEYKGGQRGAVEKYLRFLSLGGSMDPLEELQTAGVDLSTAAPIDAALDKFARVLDEAEELTK